MAMDPHMLQSTIDILIELVRQGKEPDAPFSLTELSGLILDTTGEQIQTNHLSATLGALRVKRTPHRALDPDSLREQVLLRDEERKQALAAVS